MRPVVLAARQAVPVVFPRREFIERRLIRLGKGADHDAHGGETARVMTNATRIKKLPGGGEPGGLSRFGRHTGCLQNPVGPWMP